MTPIDPAGAASAALNTSTMAVPKPTQTPATQQVSNETPNTRAPQAASDVAQTAQVNPNSRVGNFIDTTA